MTFPFMNNCGYPNNMYFQGWQQFNNQYRFTPYMPIFQFRMPMLPLPKFQYQFPAYNYTPKTATPSNNQELNPKQKAQIDEIRQMKYDSENLSAKLAENKDINTYAKYLTSSGFKVGNVLNRDDGGKIYIYTDDSGNPVGSINKNAFGAIENVALHTSDGGQISMNDHDYNGQVDDNAIISSKLSPTNENKDNNFKNVLSAILSDESNKGYTSSFKKLSNGNTQTIYTKNGKIIATAEQDRNGNILKIENFKSNGKTGTDYFYTDMNNNGIIDDGEGQIRHTIT